MHLAQRLLYLAAITLLILAALPTQARISLALLGAATALCAYALPTLA